MAKNFNYTRPVTVTVSLTKNSQRAFFEDIFYTVMTTPKSASWKVKGDYVVIYDEDLYTKIWPKLSKVQQTTFTDMVLESIKDAEDLTGILNVVYDGGEVDLDSKHYPAFRAWITKNCMGILQPMIDKVRAADDKKAQVKAKDELARQAEAISLLSKAGYVVTRPKAKADKPVKTK